MSFNTCPPCGGQLDTMEFVLKRGLFQYMPPRGGQRPAYFSSHAIVVGFNTCPHAGGNNAVSPPPCAGISRFNTCPHAGGNNKKAMEIAGERWLFQYMPPRGGQLESNIGITMMKTFQYMPPRGGQQLDFAAAFGTGTHVSIHAPTRGATTNDEDKAAR